MNRVWLVGVVGLAAGCGTQAPDPPGVNSAAADKRAEELGYKVKWPAEPTLKDGTDDPLSFGSSETHDASATARGQGWLVNYQVTVLRYPAGEKFDKTPPKDLLRRFVAPSEKLGEGLTVKDVEFGPKRYPAVEANGDRAGLRVRQVAVLTGPTLYGVTVSGTPAQVDGPEGDEFLRSFEVLK